MVEEGEAMIRWLEKRKMEKKMNEFGKVKLNCNKYYLISKVSTNMTITTIKFVVNIY